MKITGSFKDVFSWDNWDKGGVMTAVSEQERVLSLEDSNGNPIEFRGITESSRCEIVSFDENCDEIIVCIIEINDSVTIENNTITLEYFDEQEAKPKPLVLRTIDDNGNPVSIWEYLESLKN